MEADDPLAPLLRALALAEGFHCYVLLCPARKEANLALEKLVRELPALLGEQVLLVRLDPQGQTTHPTDQPTEELLRQGVLQPLLSAGERTGNPRTIHVIDATLSHCREEARDRPFRHLHDEAPWRWLFYRMNEQRNQIMAQLQGSLILCLTPPMELLFAESAADFWSIRGGDYLLPALPRPLPPPDIAVLKKLVEECLTLQHWESPDESLHSRKQALEAARRADWKAVRAWASTMISSYLEEAYFEQSFPEDVICAELLLLLLSTFEVGWAAVRPSAHMTWHFIERISATHGVYHLLAEAEMIMGAWAEQHGDMDIVWYESGFRTIWESWSGGVGQGSVEPRLIQAALGCGRACLAQGRPWAGVEWLRIAEAILTLAPWRNLLGHELPPSPGAYGALGEAYASLGDERRAGFYSGQAQAARERPRSG